MPFIDVNRLFRVHGKELVRFLSRRVACRETAADLAQEAFLRMLRLAPAAEPRDTRAYLFRTAANLAIDHGRRQRILPRADDPEAALSVVEDPRPTPETVLMSRQELRQLQAAVESLPPRARQVFLLARVEGLTYAEIGARLGISPKTAFSHLVNALALLRTRMAGHPEK